eukprot:COSAG01_NODE_20979_length_924_cov_1.056970_1_plen_192_part_10
MAPKPELKPEAPPPGAGGEDAAAAAQLALGPAASLEAQQALGLTQAQQATSADPRDRAASGDCSAWNVQMEDLKEAAAHLAAQHRDGKTVTQEDVFERVKEMQAAKIAAQTAQGASLSESMGGAKMAYGGDAMSFPLHAAAAEGNPPALEFMLAHRPKDNGRDGPGSLEQCDVNGLTPLHYACFMGEKVCVA